MLHIKAKTRGLLLAACRKGVDRGSLTAKMRTMSKITPITKEVLRLTAKQEETLDLLIKHKTSKEISRELGISPHTVDQRIEAAKRKFGVDTRGALAQAYVQYLQTYERLTYEKLHIVSVRSIPEQSELDQPNDASSLLDPDWLKKPMPDLDERGYQVGLDVFHGRYGTVYRIAAVIAIAVVLIVAILGGIAIFSELSRLLSS